MLRALPSLVDINIPDGNHFTVCGDVHGQVVTLTSYPYNTWMGAWFWVNVEYAILQKKCQMIADQD